MQKCSSRLQSNDLIKRHESKTSHRPEYVANYMAFTKRIFNIMLLPLRVLWLLHPGEPLTV